MSGEGKVVCVTGASGFIASWLVKFLLERGYTVRAVRILNDRSKVAHLLGLDGATDRLHLFEAELLEEQSFDTVVEGCHCVFHTASPVAPSAKPKEELLDPAVKGTLNVLQSCAKTPSVIKVVMTSSMSAVISNRNQLSPEVDETWFSDPEFLHENKLWYPLSKTLAEDAARKFSKENGIDLVTVNPGFVIGPLLQPTLNRSSELLLNIIKEGKEISRTGIYWFVDVRDVANAHIQASEVPSSSGRYCLVEITTSSSTVMKTLCKLYPSINIPDKYKEELSMAPTFQVSKERAKSLGINFTSLEITLKDTVESLKKKNFLQL